MPNIRYPLSGANPNMPDPVKGRKEAFWAAVQKDLDRQTKTAKYPNRNLTKGKKIKGFAK